MGEKLKLKTLEKKIKKLLQRIEEDKQRFEKDFYTARTGNHKMTCMTMKLDYIFFAEQLKKLLEE